MSLLIIYAFIFASVLVLSDMVLRRLFSRRVAQSQVNERIARLSRSEDHLATYQSLLKDRALLNGDAPQSLLNRFRRYYAQSGLTLSLHRKILYTLVIFLFSFLVAGLISPLLSVRLPIALLATLLLLYAAVGLVRQRRLRKFVNQLPPSIDIIVRSLQAGHPINAAIALVGREMPDPIGTEFGILTDQLTFGSEIEEAFSNLYERVGAEELNLLTVTISVQRNSGGNLVEVLENLSGLIRDRLMLKNKIKAISAEGRFSAALMSVFPIILYLIISTLAPSYFDPIWETGHATAIVLGGMIYMGIGIVIMNRMVRFDF